MLKNATSYKDGIVPIRLNHKEPPMAHTENYTDSDGTAPKTPGLVQAAELLGLTVVEMSLPEPLQPEDWVGLPQPTTPAP